MDVANKTRLLKAKLRIQLITFPSIIHSKHQCSYFQIVFVFCQFHFFCGMGTARSDPADEQIAQQGLSGLGFLICLVFFSLVRPGIFSMFSFLCFVWRGNFQYTFLAFSDLGFSSIFTFFSFVLPRIFGMLNLLAFSGLGFLHIYLFQLWLAWDFFSMLPFLAPQVLWQSQQTQGYDSSAPSFRPVRSSYSMRVPKPIICFILELLMYQALKKEECVHVWSHISPISPVSSVSPAGPISPVSPLSSVNQITHISNISHITMSRVSRVSTVSTVLTVLTVSIV